MKKIKQLLLVEDDRVSAFLSQMLIEESGIAEQIVHRENGAEALDYLKSCFYQKSHSEIECPQLILLDLNMPVMNGYEFMEEFLEIEELKNRNIHVVILSSASQHKEQERIGSLSVRGYIEKPLTENKIEDLLSSLPI
jgi:CheY-like chemotaxis protein